MLPEAVDEDSTGGDADLEPCAPRHHRRADRAYGAAAAGPHGGIGAGPSTGTGDEDDAASAAGSS